VSIQSNNHNSLFYLLSTFRRLWPCQISSKSVPAKLAWPLVLVLAPVLPLALVLVFRLRRMMMTMVMMMMMMIVRLKHPVIALSASAKPS
jgi:hypothetical protein